MTIHPHFRRVHHLLYCTVDGVIIGCETSPSQVLPVGWGSISVPDHGVLPTGKTHKIDVAASPHVLVALTEAERAELNRPSDTEVALRIAQELSGTDQFMMPDRPLAKGVRSKWAAYRQALRDLSKVDPSRGRSRSSTEMIADWPLRPDDVDPIPQFRSRI